MKKNSARLLPEIPRSVLLSALVRIVLVIIFVASVMMLWYSLKRLPPVQKLLRDAGLKNSTLANQVQALANEWKPEVADRVDTQFKDAVGRLFAGEEQRGSLIEKVKDQANSVAFNAAIQVGPGQPHRQTQHKLTLHRATVELQPTNAPNANPTPYERLMGLVKTLESSTQRVDVVELSVGGASNSVQNARMVLEIWSKEPN